MKLLYFRLGYQTVNISDHDTPKIKFLGQTFNEIMR